MDKVQHFELPVDDIARARKFYEKSFGWNTAEWPLPDAGEYISIQTGPIDNKNMWKEAGFINGGMFKRGAAFPINGPTIAITVDDIDKTLEKIKASGGTISMDKTMIANMGFYAYIKDTEGNIVGVWQNLKK